MFDINGTGQINVDDVKKVFSNEAKKDQMDIILEIFMSVDSNNSKDFEIDRK